MNYKGHISINDDPNSKLNLDNFKNYIADSLRQEDAEFVDVYGDTIDFKVGWVRPLWAWKILVPITSGTISVREENGTIHIDYRLTFQKMIIVATILVLIVFLFSTDTYVNTPANLLYLSIGWIWLVGGNIISTAYRFPRFIKQCALETRKLYYWEQNK